MKNPPKKPRRDKSTATLSKGEAAPSEQRGQNGHAHGTERDEAGFDFAAGQISSRKTAQANANGCRGLEITALLRIGKIEHVLRVDDDEELNQRRQGEEVGVAHRGQPEHTIFADQFDLRPQVGQKIGLEFFRRISRLQAPC